MLAHSRQRCGDAGAEGEALAPVLQRLCTELLGTTLAARLLRSLPGGVVLRRAIRR
jgi:hypothetical protein